MLERDFDWEYLNDLAGRVAEVVAEKWDVVEADDVRQEILEYASLNRGYVSRMIQNEEVLRKVFFTAGRKYAVRERDYRDLVDDEYYYTPGEARHALKQLAKAPEMLGAVIGKKDDLTKCDITDNIHTACLEARCCLKNLNPRYRKLLVDHYVYDIPFENQADRKACQRGAVALSREMNRSIRKRKKSET